MFGGIPFEGGGLWLSKGGSQVLPVTYLPPPPLFAAYGRSPLTFQKLRYAGGLPFLWGGEGVGASFSLGGGRGGGEKACQKGGGGGASF